jgi:segregation and condensation protein B
VEARRAIEAILLVSAEPTPAQLLAQLLELPLDVIGDLCRELAEGYQERDHGFQLVEVAGGWRYQTHPDLAPYIERFAVDGMSTRLSNAALETLAIVAYKQPISRAQVSAIRGVNVDGVLRTLVQRGYVTELGRDTGAGQAVLFGTTSYFLERVGLRALDELPSLGDFVPSAEVVEALEQTLRVDPDPDPDPEIDVEVDEAEDATTTGADDTNDTGGTAGVETGVPEPDLGAEPGSGDIEPDTGTSPTA